MEDFDISDNDEIGGAKGNAHSPKSAHHAMGLEAANYHSDGEEMVSPSKAVDFGTTEEEQRKGLWKSIFGYFRGPKKGGNLQNAIEPDSRSVKEITHHEMIEETKE